MITPLRWLKSLNTRRAGAFCLAYISICAVGTMYLLPSVQAPEQTIEGAVSTFKTCGRSCDEGIQVGTVVLACSANLFGHAFHCRQDFNHALPGKARYILQRTVLSSLGVSSQSSLLLQLEQQEQIVFARNLSEYRASALYFSWTTYVLLILVLGGALRMSYFRRSSVGK